MIDELQLKKKQEEFNEAMLRYHQRKRYINIQKLISIFVIISQVILFLNIMNFSLPLFWHVFIFLLAYFLTDLVNGLGHMYMDNSDSYNSLIGPYIASFHLHHRTVKYKNHNLFLMYFNETGTKLWLFPAYISVLLLSYIQFNEYLLTLFVYIGFLSCLAELSHYLCHNSSNKSVHFLQNIGILLSPSKHKQHHACNNIQYAFLNGSSDFIIDAIAKKLYKGYKITTDRHYETYEYKETKNRRSK